MGTKSRHTDALKFTTFVALWCLRVCVGNVNLITTSLRGLFIQKGHRNA